MTVQILSLVGAAGGVGTTRLAVEAGGTLARAGRDVAVFDAAVATQGLLDYVPEPVDADVTALVTEEASLEETLYSVPVDCPGNLNLCPARGPFERLSRAQTAGSAERFEQQLAAAALSHDVVLVDTPPINSNLALAGINAADRRALVTSGTERGAEAAARMRDRLADTGHAPNLLVVNQAGDAGRVDADILVPASDVGRPSDCPAATDPGDPIARPVATLVEELLDTSLNLEFPDGSRFGGLV